MAELPHTAVVVIVDDDIGFVLWTGQLLSAIRSEVVPALSCQEALRLTAEMKLKADMVIVNPGLPLVSEMLHTLSRGNNQLRIVFIRNPDADLVGTRHPYAVLERPSEWETISWTEWLIRMQNLMDSP